MVKLTSFMVLSTLIIAPTFASELRNIETRDVAEPRLLFAREKDFDLPDFARRGSGAEEKSEKSEKEVLMRHDDAHNKYTREQLKRHAPFHKHELHDEEPDHEHNIDEDLFDLIHDELD